MEGLKRKRQRQAIDAKIRKTDDRLKALYIKLRKFQHECPHKWGKIRATDEYGFPASYCKVCFWRM